MDLVTRLSTLPVLAHFWRESMIKPATFSLPDGSEREGYEVVLISEAYDAASPEFTGLDLARARKFMEDTANVSSN
jgi:hypothetical protein